MKQDNLRNAALAARLAGAEATPAIARTHRPPLRARLPASTMIDRELAPLLNLHPDEVPVGWKNAAARAYRASHPLADASWFTADRAAEANRRGATLRQADARRRSRSNDVRRRARAAGLLD